MQFLVTLVPGNWSGETREYSNPFRPDSDKVMREPVNVPLDSASTRRAWEAIKAFAKECNNGRGDLFTSSLEFELRDGSVVTVAPSDWDSEASHHIQFSGKGSPPHEVADLTWRVMEVTDMAVVGGETIVARSNEILSRAPDNFGQRHVCTSASELREVFEETPDLWKW